MSLTGLITFIAGTKAKASEVNSNFTKVKSFVDTLESNIATNTADISALESDKANVNGNASNRFAVADAVNNTDAMNKQKFMEMTHNSRRFINGLNVTKTDDDTIAIAIGSAFDSTFEKIMLLNAGASVTNSTQSASTTYYVYLISKEDGTTQCIVSTEAVTPSLPSGYVYFRQIANYKTDADNKIAVIELVKLADIGYVIPLPDYTKGVSKSTGSNQTVDINGLLVCSYYSGDNLNASLVINGVTIYNSNNGYGSNTTISLTFPVQIGDVFNFSGSAGSKKAVIYPLKGAN